MNARISLACWLLWVAACNDPKIIGYTDEMSQPDGGLTPAAVDQMLAQYAKEIGGVWENKRPPAAKITFTPSETTARGGSAQVSGFSDIACLFIDCPFDSDGKPTPPPFDSEYWLLRLTDKGALVTLPDPTGFPFAINCTYVPASDVPASRPRLECGPEGRFVMERVD